MDTTSPPKKKSSLRTLFWMVLLVLAGLIVLQMTGLAKVVGKAETETIIDRPHDR